MITDKLHIMREGAAARAAHMAELAAEGVPCPACGRRFAPSEGYLFAVSPPSGPRRVGRLCFNCGARLAALMRGASE